MTIDEVTGINPALFKEAWELATSRPGMGSLVILWNPYEVRWDVRIDYSDNTRFAGHDFDINKALEESIHNWKTKGDDTHES